MWKQFYRGKIPMVKDGDILGHEFMGVVEEAGSGVTGLRAIASSSPS